MSTIELKGRTISFQAFEIKYLEKLVAYFSSLSAESKSRFGPHPFDKDGILSVYHNDSYRLYIALEKENQSIIAYTVAKLGWVENDIGRLQSYKIDLTKDYCTIAPSVADNWQSIGLGSQFFRFVSGQLADVDERHKIVLWGGVQATNLKAIRFYVKQGFTVLGEFEHHGNNIDMVKISQQSVS